MPTIIHAIKIVFFEKVRKIGRQSISVVERQNACFPRDAKGQKAGHIHTSFHFFPGWLKVFCFQLAIKELSLNKFRILYEAHQPKQDNDYSKSGSYFGTNPTTFSVLTHGKTLGA